MRRAIIALLISITIGAGDCPKSALAGKVFVGTGVYVSERPDEAMEMASLIALDDLAKQVGTVLQTEQSLIQEGGFSTKMTTSHATLLKGHQVVSKTYDTTSNRASVVVQIDGAVISERLCTPSAE